MGDASKDEDVGAGRLVLGVGMGVLYHNLCYGGVLV
jgi:hypothetical protein